MKSGMATTTTTTPFVMRLIGALALDPVTYEEVEADRSATGQAMRVAVLSSVGAGGRWGRSGARLQGRGGRGGGLRLGMGPGDCHGRRAWVGLRSNRVID